MDIPERLAVGEALAKNIPQTKEMLEFWVRILRDKVRTNADSIRKDFLHIDRIVQTLEVLRSTNANSRLILENMLLSL